MPLGFNTETQDVDVKSQLITHFHALSFFSLLPFSFYLYHAIHNQEDDVYLHEPLMVKIALLDKYRFEVMKLYPKFSLKSFEKRIPYQNPEVKKRLIDALSKAGLK